MTSLALPKECGTVWLKALLQIRVMKQFSDSNVPSDTSSIACMSGDGVNRSAQSHNAYGPAASAAGLKTFIEAHPTSLDDLDVLEATLALTSRTRNPRRVANALLTKFGSFGAVVNAPLRKLLAVEEVGEKAALAIKVVGVAALHTVREQVRHKPIFHNSKALEYYLRAKLCHETVEVFYVLYLDKLNRLIVDEELWRGTIDQVMVYYREVIKHALDYDASALILVHNHPSGCSKPSWQDIKVTETIIQAAEVFNISIYDHIIVGSGINFSLRDSGLAFFNPNSQT